MPSLADRLVPDELWALVHSLLPPRPPRDHGGRPRQIPDRACFAAVVFMARTSTPWELLPAKELGCGSASTVWRRFTAWTRAGVFDRLSLVLLDELGEAGRIDWSRVSVDSVSLRAVKGGAHRRKPYRPRQGRQQAPPRHRQHRDPAGGGADRGQPHDSTLFGALLDELPAVATPAGQRRRRPGKVHADKAYDHARCRADLRRRGVKARIARRGIEASERLGRYRWRVERTIAWLLGFRRLRIRYEVSDERFFAFALLACSLVCFRTLTTPPGCD